MWELASLALFVYTLLVCRLCYVVPCFSLNKYQPKSTKKWNRKYLMVLLGSGGHTGEMLRMLSTVDNLKDLRKIMFVVSAGDSSSVEVLEKFIEQQEIPAEKYTVMELPRARKVGESLLSSVKSTLYSTFVIFTTLSRQGHRTGHPDILMTNGPGTAVPLALFFSIWNFFGESQTKILYIESLARVEKLSLSGRLCKPLAHRFLTQWQSLATKEGAEYHGMLV